VRGEIFFFKLRVSVARISRARREKFARERRWGKFLLHFSQVFRKNSVGIGSAKENFKLVLTTREISIKVPLVIPTNKQKT
jgi:hypothetical protein